MDGVENLHIVDYERWCSQCTSKDKSESEDPCWDCLADGVSLNGVPTRFKKRD